MWQVIRMLDQFATIAKLMSGLLCLQRHQPAKVGCWSPYIACEKAALRQENLGLSEVLEGDPQRTRVGDSPRP